MFWILNSLLINLQKIQVKNTKSEWATTIDNQLWAMKNLDTFLHMKLYLAGKSLKRARNKSLTLFIHWHGKWYRVNQIFGIRSSKTWDIINIFISKSWNFQNLPKVLYHFRCKVDFLEPINSELIRLSTILYNH